MKLKRILIPIFLLVFAFILASCSDKVEVSISLDADFTTFVGEEAQLKAEVKGAENATLVFTSENPTVASVDEGGKVVALKEGTAKIYVEIEEHEGVEAVVTVKVVAKVTLDDFAPASVMVSADAEEIVLGGNLKVGALVMPASANKALVWESSDEEVLVVNSEGTVFAVGFGEAVITAKAALKDTVKDSIELKVVAAGTAKEIADGAVEYLLAQLPEYVTETFELPKHPNPDVNVQWRNSAGIAISSYQFMTVRDTTDTVSLFVEYDDVESSAIRTLRLVMDLNNNNHIILPQVVAAVKGYMAVVGDEVTGDLLIGKYTNLQGLNIAWTSSKADVISTAGKFTRPDNDTPVKLTASVGYAGLLEMAEFNVLAMGYTKEEKVDYILNEGSLKSFKNLEVTSSISLPLADNKFGAELTWVSDKPEVLDNDGNFVNMELSEEVEVTFTVTIDYKGLGYEFTEDVQVTVTVVPLNDIGKAIFVFRASEFELPKQVTYGASPQIPDQLTDLPTSVDGYPGVTISWYGKDGEFNTEMKALVHKILYTPTEVYAKFSSPGLEDVVLTFPMNIGIVASPDEFAFTIRTTGYTGLDHDPHDGMPAAEGGIGTVYALGFEDFYFKSTFERQVGEETIEKTWYFFFAYGNRKEFTADHLVERDGKMFVDSSNNDAKVVKQWGSATVIFVNTTDQTIYVDKDDINPLGAVANSAAYKPFVLDKDGYVTTVATPAMAFAPEGFTEYEIPAGGFLFCPGYIEAGLNPNLHFFADELGRKIDMLPLTDWLIYTKP